MAAGHSGGSWKVAYADFVTAMMAFFLVMWIGAQDQKIRQSVANYFVDPTGVNKKPSKTGAVFNDVTYGNVTKEEATAMGRGKETFTRAGEHGPATTLVINWIQTDEKRLKKWREEAQACRTAAARSPEVLNKTATIEQVTARELSNRMVASFTAGNPAKANDIYQDLIFWSMKEVNWTEIAEEVIGK